MVKKILSFFLCAISYLNAASGSNPSSKDTISGGSEIHEFSVDDGNTADMTVYVAVGLLERFTVFPENPNRDLKEEAIVREMISKNQRLIPPQESILLKWKNITRSDSVIEREFEIHRLVLKSKVPDTSDTQVGSLVTKIKLPGGREVIEELKALKQFKLVLQDPNSIENEIIVQKALEENLERDIHELTRLGKLFNLDQKHIIIPDGAKEIQFTLYVEIS